MLIKGELHSNKFVLYFALIGLEQDSITVYKMIFFNSKTLTFQYHLHKALFTNMNIFNDVNVGRNSLINSQLKRILFMSSNK